MPLYFAYGANMSAAAMTGRCPRAASLGLARLERHRLAVTREGLLRPVRDPRSAVHGVLWDVALSDMRALDRSEGPGCVKAVQPVLAVGGPKRALVYFGVNAGQGVLRADHAETVLAAAREQGLPGAAIAALERLVRPAPDRRLPPPARS